MVTKSHSDATAAQLMASDRKSNSSSKHRNATVKLRGLWRVQTNERRWSLEEHKNHVYYTNKQEEEEEESG